MSEQITVTLTRKQGEQWLKARYSGIEHAVTDAIRAALDSPQPERYTREEVAERLLRREALQAAADQFSGIEPANAADRNEVRIEIETAISVAFPNHPQPASEGEDGDWPALWIQRGDPLNPETWAIWGSAENDAVPYELDGARRYLPAPDTEEGS